MLNKSPTILIALLLPSPLIAVENNVISIGYSQNKFDFFDDGMSELEPDGYNLAFSHEISPSWLLSVSYSELEADGSFPVALDLAPKLFDHAATESDTVGISLSWLMDDSSWTFALNKIDNTEKVVTRLPLILETVSGDDEVASLSYANSFGSGSWIFGWSLGAQYASSEVRIFDIIMLDPVIQLNSQFDRENWSAFVDFDISYWVEHENFSWAPQLTLSWNSEISTNGDQLTVVTRNGQRRVIEQLNNRLLDTFRTPDSGFWELSVNFDWHNNWSATLSYGQSIAAESDIDSLSLDVSVAF